MSTLRLAEKKIQAPALTGSDCKTVWLGRISTFPKTEKILG
jgi:hypothetical protein